jgi:hypothetical protein
MTAQDVVGWRWARPCAESHEVEVEAGMTDVDGNPTVRSAAGAPGTLTKGTAVWLVLGCNLTQKKRHGNTNAYEQIEHQWQMEAVKGTATGVLIISTVTTCVRSRRRRPARQNQAVYRLLAVQPTCHSRCC